MIKSLLALVPWQPIQPAGLPKGLPLGVYFAQTPLTPNTPCRTGFTPTEQRTAHTPSYDTGEDTPGDFKYRLTPCNHIQFRDIVSRITRRMTCDVLACRPLRTTEKCHRRTHSQVDPLGCFNMNLGDTIGIIANDRAHSSTNLQKRFSTHQNRPGKYRRQWY